MKLHIFVDWSSVEVFGGDGQTVIPKRTYLLNRIVLETGACVVVTSSLREWRKRQAGLVAYLATAIDLGQSIEM